MKADGESAVNVVRHAVAQFHGREVIPASLAKGGSQSHGRVEEAGEAAREFARALEDQIGANAKMEMQCGDDQIVDDQMGSYVELTVPGGARWSHPL